MHQHIEKIIPSFSKDITMVQWICSSISICTPLASCRQYLITLRIDDLFAESPGIYVYVDHQVIAFE